MKKIRKHPTYRNAVHTQSVLTITSNVVYGKNTGDTPDGRKAGEPFAPGANPMHGRDSHGWLASCLSVAKLPYADAQDGISYTVSVTPSLNRLDQGEKIAQAVKVLDTYCGQGGFHMNLNVLNRDTLLDAMEHPDKYPQLTIRVSGYAVNFVRLTREQQMDVISRTFHGEGLTSWPTSPGRTAGTPCVRRNLRTRRRRPSSTIPEGDFGWIHSYETGSTVDGPGIRVTVFMSGCLLRCLYCHNPDTWHLKDGTRVSFERAEQALASYAAPLRAMGGGLTISGGEPLVQLHFTKRLFAAAKRMGLHTALDTSGFLGARADDDYLRQVDLVLLDIKSWDPATYRRATGQDVAPDAAVCRAAGSARQAGLGPLRAGARPDRRSCQCRGHRPVRGADEQCRMGRDPARSTRWAPSNGRPSASTTSCPIRRRPLLSWSRGCWDSSVTRAAGQDEGNRCSMSFVHCLNRRPCWRCFSPSPLAMRSGRSRSRAFRSAPARSCSPA